MKFAFPIFPRQSDWYPIGFFAGLGLLVGWAQGFHAPHSELLLVCCNMLLILILASYVRAQELFPSACALLAFMAWVAFQSLTMAHANYVLTSLNLPLWDRELLQLDRIFGIDHVALRSAVGSTPWLSDILIFAYTNTGWQVFLPVGLLILMRDFEHLADVVSVLTLTTIATLIISTLFPALGPFPYLSMTDASALYLGPVDTGGYVNHYTGLRDGSFREFPQTDWKGIVTFPSFHAIFSLTGFYAAAKFRYLAVVTAIFSSVVMVSAVPVGGHYVCDVIAGVAIWCAAVWLVDRRRTAPASSIARTTSLRPSAGAGNVAVARTSQTETGFVWHPAYN